MKTVKIADRELRPTAVFSTYWRFAAARQKIYEQRVEGRPAPWTEDPILSAYRFTNPFRAADRVSQYLIRHVQYNAPWRSEDLVFRSLLFKFFNRIDTWQLLVDAVGEPTIDNFDFDEYDRALAEISATGQPIYSAAYVIPPPKFGEVRKHQNHLRLLVHATRPESLDELLAADSMQVAYSVLRQMPSIGDFLAYQLVTDLNYGTALTFSEDEFVVPGPGARDGVRKCFGQDAAGIEAEIIGWMVENQDACFRSLGLEPVTLWGRPLQLIDAQNLFCEVDKYARVAHPEIEGFSGRTRIKQRFGNVREPLPQPWFPPDWRINNNVPTVAEAAEQGICDSHQQLTLV